MDAPTLPASSRRSQGRPDLVTVRLYRPDARELHRLVAEVLVVGETMDLARRGALTSLGAQLGRQLTGRSS